MFTIELWTLYAIGVLFTAFRTYARFVAVGFRNFQADDYLVWLAIIFYGGQAALGYNIGAAARGLANSGIDDAQRAVLAPGDPEHEIRVIGSKVQVAGWCVYTALVWSLKAAMLFFYIRLTDGLGRSYQIRIWIGLGIIIGTFIACIGTILLSCRPFSHYWQVTPDPGRNCMAGISLPIIWVSFISNVSTDLYLLFIPLPLLWSSSLRLPKKIASSVVLGAGVLVIMCAMLKSIFVLVDPVNGAQLAGEWGTREAFVAVVCTNLPMIFPLLKVWMKQYLRTGHRSTDKSYDTTGNAFRTIGGSDYGGGRSRDTAGSRSKTRNMVTDNTTFNESEEHIVKDFGLQTLRVNGNEGSEDDAVPVAGGIMVSNEFKIHVVLEGKSDSAKIQKLGGPHGRW